MQNHQHQRGIQMQTIITQFAQGEGPAQHPLDKGKWKHAKIVSIA